MSVWYSGQKFIRTATSLFSTRPRSAENDPPDLQIGSLSGQLKQCPAGADLDII
jgi:hypothetical protein